MTSGYLPETIDRAQADALPGLTVLQFGTDWCGYCRAAEPHIERALADVDGLTRILVEDGKGRALGRSYRVKLWPTLVFLVDGTEVARVVRPWSVDNLAPAVDELRAAAAGPEAG
ncbi:MAG: thioredoxin family protein [Propionibacteriaceae bacterium]|nr:thioredoxin family protein [Propionibacteriaceae bacterium]